MRGERVIGGAGWWWAVGVWLPFALYSMPFIVGDFHVYRQLTIAALAGHLDIAGLHIASHLSTWQLHSLTGLVYTLVAPFQFNASFRARHLKLHKQMGYVFMCASTILGVTGSSTMLLHSEFGSLGRVFMGIAGGFNLLGLVLAIYSAKHKHIQEHRRWMIRTVVMGYTVISFRIALVAVQKVLHRSFDIPVVKAADYSILGALIISTTLVECYIQLYVTSKKVD